MGSGFLQVLVSPYRLIAPGSEWKLHRDWFASKSAMADLLEADFGLAEAHKLYASTMTFCCGTKRICFHISWRVGATCSTRISMCCSTI